MGWQYPLEDLIKQIENCCDFAIDGGALIDEVTLVTLAYTNIFNTDLYHHDCINRMHPPAPQRTWNNFKMHFLEAQCLQQLQAATLAKLDSIAQTQHPKV